MSDGEDGERAGEFLLGVKVGAQFVIGNVI